jgi:hypothetical protein
VIEEENKEVLLSYNYLWGFTYFVKHSAGVFAIGTLFNSASRVTMLKHSGIKARKHSS